MQLLIKVWVGAVLVVCLTLLIPGGVAQAQVKVFPIELDAVKMRQEIKAMHVVLDGHRTDSAGTDERFRRELWRQEESLREDLWRPVGRSGDWKKKAIRRTVVLANQEQLFWTDERLPGDIVVPVQSYQLSKAIQLNPSIVPVDPRLIGMDLADSFDLCGKDLNVVIGNPDRSESAIATVEWNGASAREVVYKNGYGIAVRIVFAEKANWNPVSIRYQTPSMKGPLSYQMEVAEFSESADGLFFPKKLLFQRRVGDSEWRQEALNITVISVNKPLDPRIFSIEGMDIPAGTPISAVPGPDTGRLLWDGQRTITTLSLIEPEAGPPINLFYLTAACLAMIAVVAAFFSLKARKTAQVRGAH